MAEHRVVISLWGETEQGERIGEWWGQGSPWVWTEGSEWAASPRDTGGSVRGRGDKSSGPGWRAGCWVQGTAESRCAVPVWWRVSREREQGCRVGHVEHALSLALGTDSGIGVWSQLWDFWKYWERAAVFLLGGCKGAGLRTKFTQREAGRRDRKMDFWRHHWAPESCHDWNQSPPLAF